MFFRKLIVLLLLGFYGIPAALGPHWHHHRCTEPACTSSPTTASVPAAAAHTSRATCHCHHHAVANHAVTNSASKKIAKPLAWTEACSEQAGPCAICAFYASAQVLPLVLEFPSQRELVFIVPLLEPLATSPSLALTQARGPPTV